MFKKEEFIVDEVYGERLLISEKADPSKLDENIRVARVLLGCFEDMNIRINEHLLHWCLPETAEFFLSLSILNIAKEIPHILHFCFTTMIQKFHV